MTYTVSASCGWTTIGKPKSDGRPSAIECHVLPWSSLRSTPMPGRHLRACSCSLIPGTISHESPPSALWNSDAGSTPHHSSLRSFPGSSAQMLASARPSSFGNAGADFVSLNDLPRSVERSTFIPKNALQLDAYIFGAPRVSTRVEYTATPEPNGPRSAKERRLFAPSATNKPFLVPMERITRSGIINLLRPRGEW